MVFKGSLTLTYKCKFENNSVYGYTCIVDKAENLLSSDLLDTSDHVASNKVNENVKMVSFTRSSVKELPASLFTELKNLEILDLADVGLMSWNRGFLKNAKKLKKIWLDNNNIGELADNSFMGASETLEVVVLKENGLKYISEKAFSSLSHCRNLDIEKNLIELLSQNMLAPLVSLKELNMKENKIKKIEDKSFEKNVALELLNLSDNYIEELTEDIFKNLAKLTIIHLQRNKIATISEKIFENCKNLIEVRLDDNKIENWPAKMTKDNGRLKMLDLMKNKIGKFDGSFLPSDIEYLYIGKKTVCGINCNINIYL